ncbi:MAG: long-chain fatty acid--CoA ligase [Myxococcota bacterium]
MSEPRLSSWLAPLARFRPDAEALFDVATGRRWTYASLQADSQRWAARLRAEGVAPGDRVAVLAANRGETFALLFAAAELQATLFPMNWRLSPAELAWQLEHAAPRVLFTDPAHAGRVPFGGCTLSLDDDPGTDRFEGPGAPLDAPWQLMYTSGSTGRPKGALLTHRQTVFNAVNTGLACSLVPDDATLTFTPLFHTGGMNCLSTPLFFVGGRVVLTTGVDAAQSFELVARERVTLLMGVPTIYQLLADHPGFAQADLSSVRDALCGGAPLPVALLERWLDRDIPLRQGFGMTEVGPNCFSMPPARVREKLGSVGLPIHLGQVRVVDAATGAPAAIDAPGELQFRGPTVFGGYLDDPAATAKAIDADGWFHTGDIVSVDADGFFTVRGRLKEMFISGGENVYPAEVEAAILEHDGVALAAVVGVPDERWGEVGHAYVELRPDHTLDDAELRDFLAHRLARFKQPKRIVVVAPEALPRTASGKLDKVALQKQAATDAPSVE